MEEITTPSQFRKSKRSKDEVIQLPSGNRVRVQRPAMEKFLSAGFLPDPLVQDITNSITTRSGRNQIQNKSQADLAEIMFKKIGGAEGLSAMMRITDKLAAYCIVEPPTEWHERSVRDESGKEVFETIPDSERSEEILYTDEIEEEDKMFIFQFCTGGTSDLSQFREATGPVVAALSAGGEVVETTERDPLRSGLV